MFLTNETKLANIFEDGWRRHIQKRGLNLAPLSYQNPILRADTGKGGSETGVLVLIQ
jgi:hypothetical protein